MPTTVDGKEVVAAHEKPVVPEEETPKEEVPKEEVPKEEAPKATDWEDRYKNLEKKLGEQGAELGKLRKENRAMQEKINTSKEQLEVQPPGPMTPDQQLLDVQRQVRDGEISWEDGLVQASSIAAKIGSEQSKQWFQQELGNRDAKANAQRFLDKHPDFLDLQESGALDEVMSKDPGVIQDQVSAYFAYKAQQGEEVGYNRAKEELNKLAESEQKTKTVLKKPGSTIRQTNNKPLKSKHDIKASMLDALSRLKEE